MSIVHTADVFCDGPDCSLWTHGATEGRPPKHSTARANAARDGWARIGYKDYCPRCKRVALAQKENQHGTRTEDPD